MHPVLFSGGGVSIDTVGVLRALSLVLAYVVGLLTAKRYRIPEEYVLGSFVTVTVLAGLGSRVACIITMRESIPAIHSFADAFNVLRGGYVFYGTVIGAVLGIFVWSWGTRYSFFHLLDFAALPLAMSSSLRRVGCFFAGCCYGKPVSWGFVFHEANDLRPRHPTQLYEALGLLVVSGLLLKCPPEGQSENGRKFGLFLITYGVLRFSLECIRADSRGAFYLGLSPSQLLSLAAFGLGLLLRSRHSMAL